MRLDDATATPIPAEDIPEYRDFLVLMRDFYEKGFWSKNVLNNTVSSGDAFMNGTSACQLHNMETVASTWRQTTLSHPEWKPEVVDLMEDFPTNASSYIVDGMAIFVNSDNLARSLMWMDTIRSDKEIYDLFYYGVKGKHWQDEGDGPACRRGPNAGEYDTFSIWGMRTKQLARMDVGQWPEWTATMDNYAKRMVDNPILYMPFDDSGLKNENAALGNLSTKYWGVLLFGFDEDPLKLQDTISPKYKEAGQLLIREEWLKQRDAYLSRIGQ